MKSVLILPLVLAFVTVDALVVPVRGKQYPADSIARLFYKLGSKNKREAPDSQEGCGVQADYPFYLDYLACLAHKLGYKQKREAPGNYPSNSIARLFYKLGSKNKREANQNYPANSIAHLFYKLSAQYKKEA